MYICIKWSVICMEKQTHLASCTAADKIMYKFGGSQTECNNFVRLELRKGVNCHLLDTSPMSQ